MKILVINCGSSSLKYKLFDMNNDSVLAEGKVERIGEKDGIITHQTVGKEKVSQIKPMPEHSAAISECLRLLTDAQVGAIQDLSEIKGIGHRVLHGGEYFKQSTLVDDTALHQMEELRELGPLHMPANILGIRSCRTLMPGTPQAAVFDTAFHSTMPKHAFLYAIPYELYQRYRIRRYGFHGTSHNYIALRVAQLMKADPKDLKIISCHLGNGASLAAIDGGKSVDTSMGFTPLEGLMMGTRSGDIDPSALEYVMEKEQVPMANIINMLNKHSGLYGIADAGDMRDIVKGVEEQKPMHMLAYDMYEYRIRKYIGAYIAAMNGVDAIAFTAGIGENTPSLRAKICDNLSYFGVAINHEINQQRGEFELSTPESKIKVYVVPTDEEIMIARDTLKLISENNNKQEKR
ncbi:MAG: acetate kinase [Firmicutes bacterium]|jgi:acetate kinase|nr:acetate kinase [Bacillota bacterium]NLL88726.1 acetate kinase [Bacillota bacterium]HKM17847.1 acetate kinase [Limnochordia bacterium]